MNSELQRIQFEILTIIAEAIEQFTDNNLKMAIALSEKLYAKIQQQRQVLAGLAFREAQKVYKNHYKQEFQNLKGELK